MDTTRARRAYSLNEALIVLMSARIKREVAALIEGGMDVKAVNERMVDIVFVHDHWREETLQRLMAEFDALESPATTVDDVAPMRAN